MIIYNQNKSTNHEGNEQQADPAAAEVSHPAKQGLVQGFSVYIDTIVVCTATALMILITGMYSITPEGQEPIVDKMAGIEAGPIWTQEAVESILPGVGSLFVSIAIFFFAFTTLIQSNR